MNTREFILSKQIQWALNNGIILRGSKGDRGRKCYTTSLEDNLFEPLSKEIKSQFRRGDGGELSGVVPKMCALHSSSALGLNVFHYWKTIGDASTIAQACKFCLSKTRISTDIRFEQKFSISPDFRRSPNLDVVIQNEASIKYKVFAIECKFSEAYRGSPHAFPEKYLKPEHEYIWKDIAELRKLAETLYSSEHHYLHLDAGQLIKHILGLKNAYGKTGFRLMYLWYDALGKDGYIHRKEVDDFSRITKVDGVKFHALTYQELIHKLTEVYREQHEEYVKYLTERYL